MWRRMTLFTNTYRVLPLHYLHEPSQATKNFSGENFLLLYTTFMYSLQIAFIKHSNYLHFLGGL